MDFTLQSSEYQQLKQIITSSGGMFAQPQDFKTKEASMVFTLNGQTQTFDQVTFSLGGVSSRYYAKQAFNIKIRGKNQQLFGRKQFRIRSDAREPTMIRSKLFCDISNRLGIVNSVSANYINMSINGEDLGFYVIMDSLKMTYVEIEYNDKDTTNLIQCKDLNAFLDNNSLNICTSENDDNPDKSNFNQLLRTLNSANSINQISQVFDIDNYLKSIILEWLTGSWDHYTIYGHNYNVYKIPNGKWTMTLYDFDATFGQDLSLGLFFRVPQGINSNNVNTWPNAKFEDWIGTNQYVIQLIMKENKNLFLQTLQEIINNAFNPGLLFDRIDEIKDFIRPYVKADRTPVNGKLPGRLNPRSNCYDYSYEQFENNSEFTTLPSSFNGMTSNSYGLKKWILDKFVFVCKNYNIDCSIGKDYLNNFDYRTTTKKTRTTTIKTTTTTNSSVPTSSQCWSNSLGFNCCSNPNAPVVYEDNDGQWGFENGNWCGIPKTQSCWSTVLGFNCCSNPNTPVVYEDNDGQWGLENNNWCGIPKKEVQSCWSTSLGYNCCSSCISVVSVDNSGKWGIENGDWCGIPVNC
ncbi:hypothetical protein BCR32DRAFT_224457 [Anaeromyces robustus]|uniref:CBM10 domain-containing protein n=1 Tax=Anaeromyces robustus TaxID=1754192 RepID=A0A1Y1WSU7_9FUNG|nr:hypothetical protein BCR32DRAFT_224457 [Anaeromyces robustus]|eukprot:ORX76204.1 hypothetical protein BCR32DRAFT_224457 [Anaeromyces robustus]